MFKSCRGPPAVRLDNFSQLELVKRPQNKPRQLWYVDAQQATLYQIIIRLMLHMPPHAAIYSRDKKGTYPYYISPIEIGLL